jgi:pimeloyl-ACP methyl ester carboxylesterase
MDTLTVAPPIDAPGEQSRALYPDETGYVERDGVRVFWEAYGHGEPTLLLLPTWSLVHSRLWKAQIPYLARHFRAVTFDARGNGRSDRPQEVLAYAEAELARDALDVMDATGTDRAMLLGNSRGVQRGLLLATEHPERVLGAVFIGAMFPASRLGGLRMRLLSHPRMRTFFLRRPLSTRGWLKFNAQHLRADYDDFVDWFVGLCLSEPHSTKQIEDMTEWAHETDPETLIRTLMAPYAAPLERSKQLELARRVRCPVLVIHGRHDRVRSHADGRELARATGARLLTIEDAGHVPHARKPVPVNLAVRDFVGACDPAVARDPAALRDPTVHGSDGRERALFVSSPIGLGHARRDVAIARELRALVPDVQIDWLAQDPVTRVLEAEGETIHPASVHLASESGHFESECAEHDLHCFQALRRMD